MTKTFSVWITNNSLEAIEQAIAKCSYKNNKYALHEFQSGVYFESQIKEMSEELIGLLDGHKIDNKWISAEALWSQK